MARPITWLPRLHEIRRSVADSVRSHYTRRELEVLFQIQQGAASRLLEIVPTLKVNGSYLAEREGLLGFLDKVSEAEDVTTLMRRLRADKSAPTRRSVRSMVRRDTSPVSLAGIPDTLRLARGHMEISFETMEELVGTLYILARILDDDLEAFAHEYEPLKADEIDEAREDVRRLFAELEEMKAAQATH
jgi:hypothetical protein